MMAQSTRYAMLAKLSLFSLALLPLAFGATSPASAATANVTSFNATRKGNPPTELYYDFLEYTYTASWTDAGRNCYRTIDWYANDIYNTHISSAIHSTSPASVSGSEKAYPNRSEGTGNYYKIKVQVQDTNNPLIVYAWDVATDGDLY